jgi:hypothetical protein
MLAPLLTYSRLATSQVAWIHIHKRCTAHCAFTLTHTTINYRRRRHTTTARHRVGTHTTPHHWHRRQRRHKRRRHAIHDTCVRIRTHIRTHVIAAAAFNRMMHRLNNLASTSTAVHSSAPGGAGTSGQERVVLNVPRGRIPLMPFFGTPVCTRAHAHLVNRREMSGVQEGRG